VNAKEGDPVAAVQALSAGGVDFAFECLGSVPTVQQAVAMTGRGGTTVLVGVVPISQLVPISAADLTLQQKHITGSYMGSNRFRFDMPKYVDFYLDGRLRLDEMISARIPLADVNHAFDRMRKGEAARQVIVFDR
jgi:S-(hydroxymethyl)glutathione dehydrogenase / alcohol dehydrogenase